MSLRTNRTVYTFIQKVYTALEAYTLPQKHEVFRPRHESRCLELLVEDVAVGLNFAQYPALIILWMPLMHLVQQPYDLRDVTFPYYDTNLTTLLLRIRNQQPSVLEALMYFETLVIEQLLSSELLHQLSYSGGSFLLY